MADGASVGGVDLLDALADQMDGLATSDLPVIDRAGLVAVNQVAKPALIAVTPVAFQVPNKGSNAQAPSALREAVRSHIAKGQGDRGQAAVTDFGDLNYVAHWIDAGHHKVVGGYSRIQDDGSRRGPGAVVGYVPAYPFVRNLMDSPAFNDKAQEAYVAGAAAKVEELMRGK